MYISTLHVAIVLKAHRYELVCQYSDKRIDPIQNWPPLIFVAEKNYLLTKIY